MAVFQLERNRQVVTVDMNDVQFCDFTAPVNAIGTRNLKRCHVVIIFSDRGAVLAHISPGPGQQQPRTSESMNNHIAAKMEAVKAVYMAHRGFFSNPGPETHTVHAWLGGEIALPDQERLIAEGLTGMGLPNPTSHRYNVDLQANTSPNSSKGPAILLGSSPPRLLVEDKIVAPVGQTMSSSSGALSRSTTESSSSSGTPAGIPGKHTGWVFTGNLFVAYRNGTRCEATRKVSARCVGIQSTRLAWHREGLGSMGWRSNASFGDCIIDASQTRRLISFDGILVQGYDMHIVWDLYLRPPDKRSFSQDAREPLLPR